MDSIEMLAERKPAIRGATPAQHVKQRIHQAADTLNRAGDMAARVELANEALCRLTEILYRADSDGEPANIDPATYRILLPVPWGSAGWRLWGLRHHEGGVLRCILLERQRSYKLGARSPLFVYHPDVRAWHLNVGDYPAIDAARHWLKRSALTLGEWRRYTRQYRDGVSTVQKRYRQR